MDHTQRLLEQANRCEFLDDDGFNANESKSNRRSRLDSPSSVQWIFNDSSFQFEDDIVPLYPLTNSESPSGGQCITLPNIEIRDCWEPGMGLSDEDNLPRSHDTVRRSTQGYPNPVHEIDMVMTTLEREELRQFVQRQEIVKSLRIQAEQQSIPAPVGTASPPVVVAQLSEPLFLKRVPAKPRRKPNRKAKKEDGAEQENVPSTTILDDGTVKLTGSSVPTTNMSKKRPLCAKSPSEPSKKTCYSPQLNK
uniref:Uncharacterized protein n=1 Tax=Spongospora subterranea TaxID=70186 RepID=A0A0H5RSP0_9EUKA|eukprot:CRZ11759.1 hypothetical protein [Spongospora subterranea]